jgi:hypothetical protein
LSQGRFAAIGTPQVIGTGAPQYPQLPANSPWSGQQPDPGNEPAFGVPIDIVERD